MTQDDDNSFPTLGIARNVPTTSPVCTHLKGRQALGRALVRAHDRVQGNLWREIIEEMKRKKVCMIRFDAILLLGDEEDIDGRLPDRKDPTRQDCECCEQRRDQE